MTKISCATLITALIVAGVSGAPAMAATTTKVANSVPFCSSTTAQLDLKNGVYQNRLQRRGSTLDSVEIWNGCIKATYSQGGHSSVVFFDPDTLQQVGTLGGLG